MTDLQALAQQVEPGSVVVASRPLTGGVSAQVTALTLKTAGGSLRQVVVREYGARDLQADPQVAAREFAVLHFLTAHGLPVPAPLWHGPGALVEGLADGDSGVEAPADPGQMAAFLARLHSLQGAASSLLGLHVLPAIPTPPAVLDDSLSEGRIRAALTENVPLPGTTALLHGDFWPGNTLWQAGQLTAVIDWEDAALGNGLSDVGNARLELLFLQGEDAMGAFTRAYAEATGADFGLLPFWDLRAALRPCGRMQTWGLAPGAEATMRDRHIWFVERAEASL